MQAGRINPKNVFYINADDNSEGLATKMEMMDDLGVHTLAPGYRDFKAVELAPRLLQMAQRDQARGVLVLIDTTKKFTRLMDKNHASAFGDACRQVAMRGGAVLNLAHVNKNPKGDGTVQNAGTTDLIEDMDAAYTITPLEPSDGERAVEFRCIKRRGGGTMSAAYSYAMEEGISYAELLASVRPVDLSTVDTFRKVEQQRDDAEVVAVIAACIAEGHNTKMALQQEVARRAEIAGRAALRMIEKYTGKDPAQHRWFFRIGERGAKVFELLPPAPG